MAKRTKQGMCISVVIGMACCTTIAFAGEPGQAWSNSLGMRMLPIPAGSFQMGQATGEFDEKPVRRVTIRLPFVMAETEVTNAQYEQFDSAHKELRGKRGISKADDEPAVFVSWHEAMNFCEWLAKKEGKPYRLPTEAEWEYACRAGTTTAFHTGDTLPVEFHREQFDWITTERWTTKPVGLNVGRMPPNAWGLSEMHGNVEEWCLDWYGPYEPGEQTDPVGRAGGDVKVSRGGSHNTQFLSLRSANRQGTLPDDKNWLIGFRVVMGELPATKPLPVPASPEWALGVKQEKYVWPEENPPAPFFSDPEPFVIIPPKSDGPVYEDHNHCPSITWCDNGDLLAAWFSTKTGIHGGEHGRCLSVAASRKRLGASRWEPAAGFFFAPDRNLSGTALFNNGKGTLYHFNGLGAAGGWGDQAMVLRISSDQGASWSTPRLIDSEHQWQNLVISGTSMTPDGVLTQPCDAAPAENGGTAIHLSRDGGSTWTNPTPVTAGNGYGSTGIRFSKDHSGGVIAGIHAGVVGLKDGRLMAFGRGDSIDGKMPVSYSSDMGKSWTYAASPWPELASGQRLVLMRLNEGLLLFVSFTDCGLVKDGSKWRQAKNDGELQGMKFTGADGKTLTGFGMFAALSFDEGATWPMRRLLTPKPGKYKTRGHHPEFTADSTHAEPRGYLAATQSPDGVIHLISSGLHYQFNVTWLKETPLVGVLKNN